MTFNNPIFNRRIFWFLFLILILIVLLLVTFLVTFNTNYVPEGDPVISMRQNFSIQSIIASAISQTKYFVIIIVSILAGFGLAFAMAGGWSQLDSLSKNKKSMISKTIVRIVLDRFWEGLLLFLILSLTLINLAAWLEDISRISPTSIAPTVVALLLSLVSVSITTIGMHYAFLAEQKAADAKESSDRLLSQKGEFLDHFSGFMKRINRKIASEVTADTDFSDSLFTSIRASEAGIEDHFYNIKCIFLTPFLGHAGVTKNDTDTCDNYERFQTYIGALIEHRLCAVQIITLPPPRLVSWYAQTQWIEEINSFGKKYSNLSDNDKKNALKKVKLTLENEKGLHPLKMLDGRTVESFEQISSEYRTKFSGFSNSHRRIEKLEICHAENLPYQMFLVTERAKDAKGKPIEIGKFAVVTFVGSHTYYTLIEDIISMERDLRANGGIKSLLRDLHAAFYTADHRFCEMLNEHFKNIWSKKNVRHYPDVPSELWQDLKFCQTDVLPAGAVPDKCDIHSPCTRTP